MNMDREGHHTMNVSGIGHNVAQGKHVEQNNFEGNSRLIKANRFYERGIHIHVAETKIEEINYKVPPDLPFRCNPCFTGREEELRAIDKCFTESASRSAPVICALTGTGGMGKTQIALAYAYREIHRLAAVFWVSATTEEAVRTSFVNIMQQIIEAQASSSWTESPPDYRIISARLGISELIDSGGKISFDPKTIDKIPEALFNWLNLPGNCKWLLIFDNADDLETFAIDKYFPKHGGGRVLVTSRRREFSDCAEQINLNGLDGESAVKLLLDLSQLQNPTEDDRRHSTTVVEKLGFMPLAISHAGYFIRERNISVSEYLRYYDKVFKEAQSKVPKLGWGYRNTAVTTWEVSFSEIQNQNMEAALLLLTCSYLNPNEIFETLWEDEGFDAGYQEKERFSLLASYSLINRNRGAFSIHPVVHDWTRERVNDSDRLQAIGSAIKVIGRTLRRKELSRSSNKWDGREERRIMAHAEVLCKYLESRFDEVLEHEQSTSKDTLHTANNIVMVFDNQGKYDEAMQWYERSLAGCEKVLGKDHPSTLDTVHNIALVFSNQGKYDEAMQWYERSLAGKEKALGKDHPSTLTTTECLRTLTENMNLSK